MRCHLLKLFGIVQSSDQHSTRDWLALRDGPLDDDAGHLEGEPGVVDLDVAGNADRAVRVRGFARNRDEGRHRKREGERGEAMWVSRVQFSHVRDVRQR